MDGGRRVSSVRQLEMLVEFAEANRDLALFRLRSKEAKTLSARLWRECAENLNSEGPARQPKEWNKVWNDMKSQVRTKLSSNNISQHGTGGGPNTNVSLTALEERVANIIGHDIGPIPNVAQDPFLQAEPEENQAVVVEIIHDTEQYESNNEVIDGEQLQLHLPGPSLERPLSGHSPPLLSPSQPLSRPVTPLPPRSPTQSQPPSQASTPRQRRQRARQRRQRTENRTRIQPQAQTSRSALDESRSMMVRIEELRARTDNMLAQSASRQAEAAVIAAEANRVQAQTMATFLTSLLPVILRYFERDTRGPSSSDADNDNNVNQF